jgi:spermidine/putrescine transport system substrate-binding protein
MRTQCALVLLVGLVAQIDEGDWAMNKPLPEDPMMRELIQVARRHQMTRRTAIAGASATAAALALAACSPGGGAGKKTLSPAKDLSDAEKIVVWDNWPYYMDGHDSPQSPTIKGFEAKSGIKVEYNVNVDDNNTYFARVKNQLASGADTGADTMCLTDWMASRLIKAGELQPMQYDLLPSVTANFNNAFKTTFGAFDPGRKYSITWKGIVAGIGYNKKRYKELTGQDAPKTFNDVFENPKLKGHIEVLSEMRDTLGIIMLSQGVDITKFSENDFSNAIDYFKKKVADGWIRGIKGNSYIDDYKSGDAVAGIVWTGDIIGANAELGRDDLGVVLLDSGSTFACDNYLIPMGAKHAKNAHKLIDYYFEPEVAAELALAGVNYVTPVNGAREIAVAKNPKIGNNPLIFPSDSDYATKFKVFRALTPAEDNTFSKTWSDASNGVI